MQTLPLPEGRKRDLIAFSLSENHGAENSPRGGEGLPYWPLAYYNSQPG